MSRRKTVFDRAIRTSYANIGWEVTDVQKFRPAWDENQCRVFLQTVERQLAAATLLAGWEALDVLIQQYEQGKVMHEPRSDDPGN
jgi:hypothetical protein